MGFLIKAERAKVGLMTGFVLSPLISQNKRTRKRNQFVIY